MSNRTTVQISITIPKGLGKVIDKILTPTSLMSVPKGSYSQLITKLLENWVAEQLKMAWPDVRDFFEFRPRATIKDLYENAERIRLEKAKKVEEMFEAHPEDEAPAEETTNDK